MPCLGLSVNARVCLCLRRLLLDARVVDIPSGPAHMRLCWVTLREIISFRVFFLKYTITGCEF